jgi:predicted deacylase
MQQRSCGSTGKKNNTNKFIDLGGNMNKLELVVGDFSAKPGERKAWVQEFEVLGYKYSLPLFLINGKGTGPTLVITGGVHAAEYASIAAALETGQTLDPVKLHGQVIIAPVINTPGYNARSIYVCPLDNINLNRVFPGDPHGGASEQIANWVFQNVIAKGDYYVDMHGGDLVEALIPFTIVHRSGDPKVDEASLEMAKVFGIPLIVASESKGSAFSAAARAGVPAILSEAGGQGIWLRKDVRLHLQGLRRLMLHLGMLKGAKPNPIQTRLLEKFIWMQSEQDGYFYPEVGIDQKVSKGQFLGKITDFQGNLLQKVEAPESGIILFLVTSLATNRQDPLIAIGA